VTHYRIRHETVYFYAEPVVTSHNELHLAPRRLPNQTLRDFSVSIDPSPETLRTRRDYFGNEATYLELREPHARLAITVGSTHREMPHVYGVSYFSSKGPTGDGRIKPDLIAPGEKIISCATGAKLADAVQVSNVCGEYIEDSGTSMAAPHVSGAAAAFLSIRREFLGQPERVKEIFCSSATDLGRERSFQGHGLIDLMRAIQSI